ncbi:MAG: cache domain-containing protein, partial [Pseudomonadota bacterium]
RMVNFPPIEVSGQIRPQHARSLANGANQKLVGKDLLELKDADGKTFMRERLEMLKTKDNGWIEYKWPNPVSGKIDPKSLYFERVDDVVVSCGIYKH